MIAAFYLLLATLSLFLIAPTMPPFQNADEPAHINRADQVGHFGIVSEKLPGGIQGGWVSDGLMKAELPFDKIRFNYAAKVSRSMYAAQEWGGLVPAEFYNTGIYPPLFYVPAAAALGAARALHLSVLHGIMAARIATGLASIAVGALAVALADATALWLFAVLLLPMSLAMDAAVSQDGLLLACSALAAALCLRLRYNPPHGHWLPASLTLALVGMARPPYAAFALVLLAARLPWRTRLCAVGVALAPVLAWSAVSAPHVAVPVFPNGTPDPAAQAHLLLHAPWRVFPVFVSTWHAYGGRLLHEVIGRLGWLDVDLPEAYHDAAWAMLALAALVTCGTGGWPRVSFWGLISLLVAAFGLAMFEYLAWSLPGSPVIDGLQGRHFVPLVLMLAAVVAPTRTHTWQIGRWAVILFPVVTIPVVLHSILLRYYF
jgi:uncharacterized membrane protein